MLCVYAISNTANKKLYYGLTKNLSSRWAGHLFHARNPHRRGQTLLSAAIREQGEDNFSVRPVLFSDNESFLANIEKRFIRLKGSIDVGGFNVSIGMDKHPQTREKMSIAQKGRIHSEETKSKLSKASMGRQPRARPCIVDGMVFSNAKFAAQCLRLYYKRLFSWLNGEVPAKVPCCWLEVNQ
jgi:group I intron endonuclease